MTAADQNRHPAGTPTGGQFSTVPRTEGDAVTLEARATYTPWCSQPDDHCLRGDCYYGDHGPLTDDAESDLRFFGYGDYVDEYQAAEDATHTPPD